MRKVIACAVDETTAAHPGCVIDVDATGDDCGSWDKDRLAQVMSNLISNAVEHGGNTPVSVSLSGDATQVVVTVHNRGDIIPVDRLPGLFAPMKSGPASGSASFSGPSGNLGLGLYIAERIVTAHGGTLDVTSTGSDGTSFVITLPRSAPLVESMDKSSGVA